jgi:AAA+ superfamily predicted ATPase
MSHSLKITLFSLFLFGWIQASDDKTGRDKSYEKYFKQQEKIYKELLELGISGARPLRMDEVLAEEVIASSPQKIKDSISGIEQSVFCVNKKNIILHGMSGTGKSCLAQAIAVKSKTPCLFFNAGTMSTEYMNSGVQNLNRIFQYAEMLEKRLGKPCIIVFDELESLTKKHASKNNNENNILISFWQELDNLSNSRVVVIGTMNGTDDLPVQITNRSSMVEIPLPDQKQRETILSYYLKAKQDKYGLIYPKEVTATSLALKTKGFSNRDLQNVVEEATMPVILAAALADRSNKIVTGKDFIAKIKEAQKDPKRKFEREIGTWKHTFKKHFRDPRTVLPLAALTATTVIAYNTLSNQKEGLDLQKKAMEQGQRIADKQTNFQQEGLDLQRKGLALQRESIDLQITNQKENVAHQKEAMKQAKEQFEHQTSSDHIAKQGAINLSILGIPIGTPFYYGKKGCEWIWSKIW